MFAGVYLCANKLMTHCRVSGFASQKASAMMSMCDSTGVMTMRSTGVPSGFFFTTCACLCLVITVPCRCTQQCLPYATSNTALHCKNMCLNLKLQAIADVSQGRAHSMDRDKFWHSEAHLLKLFGQTLIVDAMLPQDLILVASGCALQCAIGSQHELRRCCAYILHRPGQFIAIYICLFQF